MDTGHPGGTASVELEGEEQVPHGTPGGEARPLGSSGLPDEGPLLLGLTFQL